MDLATVLNALQTQLQNLAGRLGEMEQGQATAQATLAAQITDLHQQTGAQITHLEQHTQSRIAELQNYTQSQLVNLQAGLNTATGPVAPIHGPAPELVPQEFPVRTPVRVPTLPKEVLKELKVFNYSGGKDLEELDSWSFHMSNYFRYHPTLTGEQQVDFAGATLRDQAATWFRDVCHQNRKPANWFVLCEELQKTFLPVGRDKLARARLANARQRERDSVASYTHFMRKLFLAIGDIHESEKVDRYVRGLIPDLYKDVSLHEPTTFEEAVKWATKYDAVRTSVGRQIRQYGGLQHGGDGPAPMELGAMAGPSEERRRIGPCYQCHEYGHLEKDCPLLNDG